MDFYPKIQLTKQILPILLHKIPLIYHKQCQQQQTEQQQRTKQTVIIIVRIESTINQTFESHNVDK
jgi:hypothetical protein